MEKNQTPMQHAAVHIHNMYIQVYVYMYVNIDVRGIDIGVYIYNTSTNFPELPRTELFLSPNIVDPHPPESMTTRRDYA